MKKFNYYLYRLYCMVTIFLFSGGLYYILEIIFKKTHSSHWSMFVLAGFSSVLFIDGLNNLFSYEMDFLLQIFICATSITIFEYIVGINLNQDFSIWNYSNMPLNYKGQICVSYYFLWMLLSSIFIPFLDYIEWKIFKYKPDIPPYYKVFNKICFKFKEED